MLMCALKASSMKVSVWDMPNEAISWNCCVTNQSKLLAGEWEGIGRRVDC